MNSSSPVVSEAPRIGSGEIGATLKRRRMFCSRSCTARMPAPKKPLPRMPITSTLVTMTAIVEPPRSACSDRRQQKEEDQREHVVEEQHLLVAERQPQFVLGEREVGFHSRRLFPVSSMNTSSSDGRRSCTSASSMPS